MNWTELAGHTLKVYHTAWCPDCRRLETKLTDHGVPFVAVDIEKDPAAAEYLAARTGHRAIPYVEIDDKLIIRGWHKDAPGRWSEDTFFSEISAGLK